MSIRIDQKKCVGCRKAVSMSGNPDRHGNDKKSRDEIPKNAGAAFPV